MSSYVPQAQPAPSPQQVENREQDAKVRAFRTFAQGLALDVAVAGTVFLVSVIGDIEWTRTYWLMLGLGLAKSLVQGAVAYFARKLIKPDNVSF